jgi:hypothetical protein
MPRHTLLCFAGLLAACATQRVAETGILHRSPNFPLVLDSGMAVAPVGHADSVHDAGDVAAFLSNQLTTALLVGWESSFVPPDQVLASLRLSGEAGLESFRAFRLARMRNQPLAAADCTALSRIVQHRYLLLCWVHEELQSGMEENSTDYTSAGFAKDVARLHYDRVRGELTGVLVDLWQAELLWQGRSGYLTQKVYAGAEQAEEEMAAARDAGVLDLVRLLGAP